jgi:hypothetical protein
VRARTHARKARHGGEVQVGAAQDAQRSCVRPSLCAWARVQQGEIVGLQRALDEATSKERDRGSVRLPPHRSERAHRSNDRESAGEASVVCIVTPSSIQNLPPLLLSACCPRYESRWRASGFSKVTCTA